MCKSNLIRINSIIHTDGLREKCLKQNAFNYLRYLDQIHSFLNPIFITSYCISHCCSVCFLFYRDRHSVDVPTQRLALNKFEYHYVPFQVPPEPSSRLLS